MLVLVLFTVGGLVSLWPSETPAPPDGAEAPLVDGVVRSAESVTCPPPEEVYVPVQPPCRLVTVEVLGGDDPGTQFTVDTGEQGLPPLEAGDRVRVGASLTAEGEIAYFVVDYDRLPMVTLVFAVFAAAVLLVGRWHGLRSLVGLAISLVLITRFVVPAVVAGRQPLAVASVGAMAVMLVTLYLAHGRSLKTTTAVLGTAAALGLTVVLGAAAAGLTKLTGLSSEDALFAQASIAGLNLRGLVLAGLVIGALGVLDDVTVAQASTVFALHEADPAQSPSTLFRRGMSVGRDHIASTVNTLVLAYAGASLPLLLLFSTGGAPVTQLLNSEFLAGEIVKTLVGSVGLIAAVPLTTGLAALVMGDHAHPRELPSKPRGEDEDWLQDLGVGLGRRDARR